MDGWMDGYMHVCTHGWMNMDGWMDGLMDRQMDE